MAIRFLIVLALFSSSFIYAEIDLEPVLKSLNSPDYEERERASKVLEAMPGEWAGRLYRMSRQETRLEVSARLALAARRVFMEKVLTQDERFLRLFGIMGFGVETQWSEYYIDKDTHDGTDEDPYRWYPTSESVAVGERVKYVWPDDRLDDKLLRWDVIVEVDGKSWEEFFKHPLAEQYGTTKPNREYELTVRRYRNRDEIARRGEIIQTDEYDLVKVKIWSTSKNSFEVDSEAVQKLQEQAWAAFLLESGWASAFFAEYRVPSFVLVQPKERL